MTLPPDLCPRILFEDNHVIVLSKPAGLLSQGERKGDPNLVDWLRGRLGREYVGLVHRLDRNTSGLMIVGQRTKSASRLTESLQEGRICRTYIAWVHGRIEHEARWKHRLLKDRHRNVVQVVSQSHPQGQDASLVVRPLAKGAWKSQPLTLVSFELETGRSHQIRVQAAHEGHALLGDVKYGGRGNDGFPRPALHSARLSFPHPVSEETLEFEDPMPADMRKVEQVP